MRREVLPYFGLPFYRAMLERSGFEAEIAAFDAAAGDLEAMQAAISERFLDELAAVGERGAGARRDRPLPRRGDDVPLRGTDRAHRLRGHAPGGRRLSAERCRLLALAISWRSA